MDENTGDKTDSVVITNGNVTTTNGDLDVCEPKSKLVEYDCQSADITDTSAKVQKFSSKLKENAGVENGKAFQEKDYKESAQKSMQEKHDNTEVGCSSSLQLAEKEIVSETSGGGVKSEYTIGSDEQYKSKASSVNKVGDANIQTHKSTDNSYTKACSKIEEELPGNSEAESAAGASGRRVTEVSRGDYAHSEQISSSIEGPGGYSRSQDILEELSSNKHSQSTVTSPSGSSLQKTTSEKRTCKKESFRMESSGASGGGAAQVEEGTSVAAESAVSDLGGHKEIKLSTKISSDDGDLLENAAASSITKQEAISGSSKYEHVSSSQKETSEVSGGAALYNRQHIDATPSDNMSVSSMSSAHDLNDIKMSSASNSECAYSAAKMETNEMDRAKDLKYNRKSTDSLVKRILGDAESERKSKYKINMGDDQGEEDFDKDSLLQRRLASLDKTGRKRSGSESQAGGDLFVEEYEHEEMTYSRKSRGRVNRQGSGDLDSPRDRQWGRPGSRGSFEYDEEYEDSGYGGGYRGGRGRFARQNYIDDDDIFGPRMPPIQPLFRDEEFEPQKREETEEYVKEKTASIRGMVDRQTAVLENLRKASESFDELTDEIKNIRQAFIENQARRAMMFTPGEVPLDDEQQPHDQPRDQPRGGQRARSRYVQQREEDYDYAMRNVGRGRQTQYGAEDYGYEPVPSQRGRQKQYSLDEGKDDYGLSSYGRSRGLNKDLDNMGPRPPGAQDDYLSSYGRRALDKKSDENQPKSLAGQSLVKKSYYSQEDYSATYSAGADAYNRRLRGLGGRSKSLYDEASSRENEGYSLEDGGASRRGRIGLQRTQYDPLSDDVTPKDRYGVSAYGSGGTAGAGGYTRVGDPLSATSPAYSGAASSRSSYTSAASRLTSSAASSSSSTSASATAASSSTRPRFSRSRTLSDIDFDRGSSPADSTQGGFQSRFLGKVRQKSLAGEDTSRSRDKPFKSRFLRSNFDFGDGTDNTSTSTYTSSSASKRLSSKTETTTIETKAESSKD